MIPQDYDPAPAGGYSEYCAIEDLPLPRSLIRLLTEPRSPHGALDPLYFTAGDLMRAPDSHLLREWGIGRKNLALIRAVAPRLA